MLRWHICYVNLLHLLIRIHVRSLPRGATEADLGSRCAPPGANYSSPRPIAIVPVKIPFVSPSVSARTYRRDDEARPPWALSSGGEVRVRHVVTKDGQGIITWALEDTMSCWMERHGCNTCHRRRRPRSRSRGSCNTCLHLGLVLDPDRCPRRRRPRRRRSRRRRPRSRSRGSRRRRSTSRRNWTVADLHRLQPHNVARQLDELLHAVVDAIPDC